MDFRPGRAPFSFAWFVSVISFGDVPWTALESPGSQLSFGTPFVMISCVQPENEVDEFCLEFYPHLLVPSIRCLVCFLALSRVRSLAVLHSIANPVLNLVSYVSFSFSDRCRGSGHSSS